MGLFDPNRRSILDIAHYSFRVDPMEETRDSNDETNQKVLGGISKVIMRSGTLESRRMQRLVQRLLPRSESNRYDDEPDRSELCHQPNITNMHATR